MQASRVGSLVRIENLFDVGGVPADPTTVVFRLKSPDTPPTVNLTIVYPTAPIVRDAAGAYHVDYTPLVPGTWVYSWEGTGTVEVAVLGTLEVLDADIANLRVPKYMTSADLDARITAGTVDMLFDDDGDGVRDAIPLNTILVEAEDLAASYLLSGWSADNIVNIGKTDETFRAQVAWIAAELASERRGMFIGEDGKGRYWQQMQRATKYFDLLSKNRQSTVSQTSGANLQENANVNPRLGATQDRFVFAPNARSPSGQGGF